MDFNVDKQQLCACRIVREAKSEQGVDSDLTLPDYCPDIKSMLCCSIEPGISSVNITGNRITAEGNAVIRLLYVSADDKLACYEQNYPLSKYVEMNSLNPDWQVKADAKVSYVCLLLTTGLCGGFTTFSTFSNESLQMLQNGQWASFMAYVSISIMAGIGLTALGYWVVK